MKAVIEIDVPNMLADTLSTYLENVVRSIAAHGYYEGDVAYATLPDNTQTRYRVNIHNTSVRET